MCLGGLGGTGEREGESVSEILYVKSAFEQP
jgi:hypothetical protein